MTTPLNRLIESAIDAPSFAQFEHNVYDRYQAIAEQEIVDTINRLFADLAFIFRLKQGSGQCACRFYGLRTVSIRLKSGKSWDILSPVFLRAKPKRKPGRSRKRQTGALRHLGLEMLGIIKHISPALVETCIAMAVLCPSFDVASQALRGFGIQMNEHLLQNITHRFAQFAKPFRVDCHNNPTWQKPGLRLLICVDGGRIRERLKKRGKRKSGQKRQGYSTEWFEPRLLTISLFDEEGKKIQSISPIIDGSCGSLDDFFDLLKSYLISINTDEAAEIVFCADGGNGIWPRTEKLINELTLPDAKQILDYTHAKQNMNIVKKTMEDRLKLTEKERKALAKTLRELLWKGNIEEIVDIVRRKLKGKRKALKAALNKLENYFGDHKKFQYKSFRDKGLPTGSGTVESAIRRVINLRIKGAGIFWHREHAENIIFLRSIVLTGKLKSACEKVLGAVKNMFENNTLEDLPLAA